MVYIQKLNYEFHPDTNSSSVSVELCTTDNVSNEIKSIMIEDFNSDLIELITTHELTATIFSELNDK